MKPFVWDLFHSLEDWIYPSDLIYPGRQENLPFGEAEVFAKHPLINNSNDGKKLHLAWLDGLPYNLFLRI